MRSLIKYGKLKSITSVNYHVLMNVWQIPYVIFECGKTFHFIVNWVTANGELRVRKYEWWYGDGVWGMRILNGMDVEISL